MGTQIQSTDNVEQLLEQIGHPISTPTTRPLPSIKGASCSNPSTEDAFGSSKLSKAKQVKRIPSPDPPEEDAGENLCNLRRLMSDNFNNPNMVNKIALSEEVLGLSCPTLIHVEDLEDLLNKNQLNISWPQLWLMYVHELCGKIDQSSYGFIFTLSNQ